MLQSLDFTVRFEKTNRRIEQHIKFEKGFGAITGPNESGKSLVLEMIRYALFGSRALRGSVGDYHTLTVDLSLSIRNEKYTVSRSLKSCTLYGAGDEEVAVGTKPVNAKIVELLGFGMEVFDISCVVMQGEVEKLGAMGGADRKRLVDSVIGMSVIEDMIKMAGEEAKTFKRTIEAFQKSLIEPLQPLVPDGYYEGYAEDYRKLRDLKTEYDQLNGALSVPLVRPDYVEEYTGLSLESLEEHVKVTDRLRNDISDLHALIGNRKPATMLPSVAQIGIDMWDEVEKQDRISKELAQVEADIAEAGKHLFECPACGEKFHADSEYMTGLTKKRNVLMDQYQLIIRKPEKSRQEYINEIANQDVAGLIAQRNALERKLAELPDYRTAVAEARSKIATYERYKVALSRYDEQQKSRHRAEARRDDLAVQLKLYHRIESDYKLFTQYETLAAEYVKHRAAYDEAVASVDELTSQYEDWVAAGEALRTLRVQIKQHLLPALNKWSSVILHLMTGGQRNNIVVDENFDITVDNQPINTLSGSGKAVANLALRIGLGQVLTNGVLSLFIGDEIDASMDANRAGNTAEALQTLRDSILQILIVSHKSVQADYYVDLGNDQQDSGDDQ